MKYIYTAIIVPDKNGRFLAKIPDLPGCVTTGNSLIETIDLITDAASLWLVSSEDHDETIPNPTPQEQIDSPAGAIKTLIQVDTLAYRAETDTKAVRKNVSLPAWMAKMADKRGINCSKVLQEGLLRKLG